MAPTNFWTLLLLHTSKLVRKWLKGSTPDINTTNENKLRLNCSPAFSVFVPLSQSEWWLPTSLWWYVSWAVWLSLQLHMWCYLRNTPTRCKETNDFSRYVKDSLLLWKHLYSLKQWREMSTDLTRVICFDEVIGVFSPLSASNHCWVWRHGHILGLTERHYQMSSWQLSDTRNDTDQVRNSIKWSLYGHGLPSRGSREQRIYGALRSAN